MYNAREGAKHGTAAAKIGLQLNAAERAVLLEIIHVGEATRAMLSDRLGISKATVSGGVKRLANAQLISETGMQRGSLGRPAAVYQVAEAAGYALGVDLGTTAVSVRAVAIDGRILQSAEEALRPSTSDASEEAAAVAAPLIRRIADELEARGARPRSCVVAAPIRIEFGQPVPVELRPVVEAVTACPCYPELSVSVENNVNCAAIAEWEFGAAAGVSTFAYLQVGVKIGLGIVNEGRLLRGGGGGAGEVACLPYPWSATDTPRQYELERHLGAAGLIRRARRVAELGTQSGFDAASIFAGAAAGNASLQAVVATHAREIGQVAAAVIAILDPGLLVLGGGVGQSRLLLSGVRDSVRRLAWETEIRSSRLGREATVMGAARLAAGSALEQVLAARW